MGSHGSGGHPRGGPSKKDAHVGLQDATTDCTPPDGLTVEAEAYWRYYAPLQVKSGLLTRSSRETLRSYCQVLVQRDRIEVELRTSPVLIISTVVDGAGNEHPKVSANPLLAAQRQTEATLHTLANDLCLSPAAAIRLPRQAAPEQDDLDVWSGPKMRAVK